MSRNYPYTSDDLRFIADRIDEVMNDLPSSDLDKDGDWRWGLSVEIYDDGENVAGKLRPHGDGWIGFYPEDIK